MKKVTIKDIARIAGVSRGTVDRVLNGREGASDSIIKKVTKIANDLGYEKNIIASTLASNKTFQIAIVSPDPIYDPFWQLPRIGINNASKLCQFYNINVQYFDFNMFDKSDFKLQVQNAIISKPDAILMAPTFTVESLELLDLANKNEIPFITFNTEIEHPDILCYIGQNSFDSGYLAGKLFNFYLNQDEDIIVINLGHNLKNASHYSDKLKGLEKYYQINNSKNTRIHLYEFENFLDEKKLSKFIDSIIAKHTNMRGIFITNSRAYRLVNAMNVKDANRFIIIGFDMLDDNIKYLKAEKINFIINQNSINQGYYGIVAFINHFILKEKIEFKQYLPLDVILSENADYYPKMMMT